MTRLALGHGGSVLVLPTLPQPVELRTARLRLRPWRDDDLPAWVAMNADPDVRRHFGGVATEDEARAEAGRVRAAMGERGWGVWAVELPGSLPFAGFIGLHVPAFEAPFMPAVEMGWRLARAAWGQGFATEGAAAAAAFAFEVLKLDALVAYTVPANTPSRRVMGRLGMWHDEPGSFDHPRMPAAHPLRRHVLYRLDPARFAARPARGGNATMVDTSPAP